jgi:multiple sugar transport system ATP-binding protein
MVHFGVDTPQVFSDGAKKTEEEDGLARIGSDTGATFVASFSARTKVRPGELIEVAVDTAHLHFFDLNTGERL